VNEGVPMVSSDERSEAASAFDQLAEHFLEEDEPRQELVPEAAPAARKRRFAWRP
jgi:hypothetical protein